MTMHRALGRCEVGAVPGCITSQPEWHHRQRRGNGDHRPSNGIAACRPCHTHIHAHPEESRSCGWIVSATKEVDPVVIAAWLRPHGNGEPRFVGLSHGGTYT